MRTQLNVLVAATTALVLMAFVLPLGLLLRGAAEDRADASAALQAQATAALVALGQDPPDSGGGERPLVSVFYGDGRVAGASALRTSSIELAARGRAFSARSGNGIEVLVPVQGLPSGTAVVRSYVSDTARHAGVAGTWALLGGLGALLFVLGLLLADRLGRRLVGSVTALAAGADRMARGDLSARVAPSTTPELRRVGHELNRLAARIQDLLTAAREDVADLAHRLRTPVTALRLNVDLVHDPDDRVRLSSDVDDLNRIVDEVIRTARRPVREGAGAATDLVDVAGERVAFWGALAEDIGRPVRPVLPAGPLYVRSARDDLVAAVDALLENVFSHTPDDAAVRVEVALHPGGGVRLTVEDAGPGFAATAGARRGVSGGGSTGLGLDIARRTAESAGGWMHLGTSRLGGAQVTLVFACADAIGADPPVREPAPAADHPPILPGLPLTVMDVTTPDAATPEGMDGAGSPHRTRPAPDRSIRPSR